MHRNYVLGNLNGGALYLNICILFFFYIYVINVLLANIVMKYSFRYFESHTYLSPSYN